MAGSTDKVQQEARVSEDLVTRIAQGDRTAESEMVERYQRGLLFLLRRKTSDAELARDLCQETFGVALEKLRKSALNDAHKLAAYLRGIAVNLVSAHRRRASSRTTAPDSEAIDMTPDHTPGPFDNVSTEEASRVVRTLLEVLPVERDREVLIRLYLQDDDKDSICADLGIDREHLNRVHFRAKQRFKDLLMRTEGGKALRAVVS